MLKAREEMDKLATLSPLKINPPKGKFPGDTLVNNDLGKDEPFGHEQGILPAPGAHGEYEVRAPGNIGVPLDPVSPSVNSDDTERKKRVPPVYRVSHDKHASDPMMYLVPETEEWQQEKIPLNIWDAWDKAHRAITTAHRMNIKSLELALDRITKFVSVSKPYLSAYDITTAGKELTAISNLLLDRDVVEGKGEKKLFNVIGRLDTVLNNTHYKVTSKLGIDPAAWYNKRNSAEEKGVFDTHEPVSFDVKMPGDHRYISNRYKTALEVSPIPKEVGKADGPMLLQMPRDLRDRYSDLARRVKDYVKSVGESMGSLDIYKYRNSPPRDWVERELPNAKSDLEDTSTFGRYVSRYSHDEIADWADFKSVDPSTVSAGLHTQWAVSADDHDFDTWFRTNKPVVKRDESLVTFLRDRARNTPDHDIVKKYDGWWRKRYLGKVYSQAYHLAKEKWQEYVKNSGSEFAKQEYKEALELVNKAHKGEGIPVGDLIGALHSLPFENEYRTDIDSYKTELDGLVNEGMSSLDLAHDPVSRDDRLFGDMVHEGFRWIPATRIVVATDEWVDPLGKSHVTPEPKEHRYFDPRQRTEKWDKVTPTIQKRDALQIGEYEWRLDEEYTGNKKGRKEFRKKLPITKTSYLDFRMMVYPAKEQDFQADTPEEAAIIRKSKTWLADMEVFYRQGFGQEHLMLHRERGYPTPEKAFEHLQQWMKSLDAMTVGDLMRSAGPARGSLASKIGTANHPVSLYQYGSNFYLVDENDNVRLGTDAYVWADVTRIVAGSSLRKRYTASIDEFNQKSKALANAIHEIHGGSEREAVFMKYGRVYGPGLRQAVSDYFYIQSLNKNAETDPPYGDSAAGDCDTFWSGQSPDNCEGCTFNAGTGGPEFGYGGCLLTQLFLNSPNKGFGKGDEAGYDYEHMPGKPSVQKSSAQEILPGVPSNLFATWEQAHNAKNAFRADPSLEEMDKFSQALASFLQQAAQLGSGEANKYFGAVQNYVNSNPPMSGDIYSPAEGEKHLAKLDKLLNLVHQELLGLTNTTREQWYEQKELRDRDDHLKTPGFILTPEEERELGITQQLTPDQLRERRGPMAPFYEDLWERKRKTGATT